jgi:DNA-binding MarR family transcriptional regulator
MDTDASSPTSTDRLAALAAFLPRRASALARILYSRARPRMPREINRAGAGVLAALAERPRRITELADLEGQSQPYMTRIVIDLERRGWVERIRDAQDRRGVIVRITDPGREALADGQQIIRDLFASHLATLSDEQLAALTEASAALQFLIDTLHAGNARSIGKQGAPGAGGAADAGRPDATSRTANDQAP